ncbi:unnamed protein product [Cunninghamella echinulata]
MRGSFITFAFILLLNGASAGWCKCKWQGLVARPPNDPDNTITCCAKIGKGEKLTGDYFSGYNNCDTGDQTDAFKKCCYNLPSPSKAGAYIPFC